MDKKVKPLTVKKLIYTPQYDKDNNPLWTPVVYKNRDTLIHFITGYLHLKATIENAFEIELADLRMPIDSSRFNDILPDGRHFNSLSKDKQDQYINNTFEEKAQLMVDRESNDELRSDIMSSSMLDIECPGCNIPYIFKTSCDIPVKSFYCSTCGRLLIHYTGHEDYEYIFSEV